MSEVEFKKFAACDTCGASTMCREIGDEDQCGGCYWAPINKAVHEAQLAALREELAKANADKEAYHLNAIARRDDLDTRTADLLECGTRRKLAEQRLADAERRNAELIEKLGEAYEWGYGDGQNSPNGYSDKADRDACVAALKSTKSGASE